MQSKGEDITLKASVEGEKAYIQACKEMEGAVKELTQALKNAELQMIGNEISVQALTEKLKALNKGYEEQKKKVESANDAFEKMKGSLDFTSTAYHDMQESVSKSKAEMAKMEKQMEKISRQLGEQAKIGRKNEPIVSADEGRRPRPAVPVLRKGGGER